MRHQFIQFILIVGLLASLQNHPKCIFWFIWQWQGKREQKATRLLPLSLPLSTLAFIFSHQFCFKSHQDKKRKHLAVFSKPRNWWWHWSLRWSVSKLILTTILLESTFCGLPYWNVRDDRKTIFLLNSWRVKIQFVEKQRCNTF